MHELCKCIEFKSEPQLSRSPKKIEQESILYSDSMIEPPSQKIILLVVWTLFHKNVHNDSFPQHVYRLNFVALQYNVHHYVKPWYDKRRLKDHSIKKCMNDYCKIKCTTRVHLSAKELLCSSSAILSCKLQVCNIFFLDRLAARALAKASKNSLNNVEWACDPNMCTL